LKTTDMTNEEFVEEIYHEAHTEGFIDQLNTTLHTLNYTHPKLDRYERVEMAYHTVKKKMESPNNLID
jgi:hypothetical protein